MIQSIEWKAEKVSPGNYRAIVTQKHSTQDGNGFSTLQMDQDGFKTMQEAEKAAREEAKNY
jgi:hypothetical protein